MSGLHPPPLLPPPPSTVLRLPIPHVSPLVPRFAAEGLLLLQQLLFGRPPVLVAADRPSAGQSADGRFGPDSSGPDRFQLIAGVCSRFLPFTSFLHFLPAVHCCNCYCYIVPNRLRVLFVGSLICNLPFPKRQRFSLHLFRSTSGSLIPCFFKNFS